MIGSCFSEGLTDPSENHVAYKADATTNYGFQKHMEQKLHCVVNDDFAEKYDKSNEHEGYCNRYQDVDDACAEIPTVVSPIAFDIRDSFHLRNLKKNL